MKGVRPGGDEPLVDAVSGVNLVRRGRRGLVATAADSFEMEAQRMRVMRRILAGRGVARIMEEVEVEVVVGVVVGVAVVAPPRFSKGIGRVGDHHRSRGRRGHYGVEEEKQGQDQELGHSRRVAGGR